MFSLSNLEASVPSARVLGRFTTDFVRASIDSRTIGPGDLFFAIRAQNDGHAFVSDAIRGGAAGVVVSDPSSVAHCDGVTVVLVPDTLSALQEAATGLRRIRDLRVIGITGSAGKTTTKDMVAHTLRQKLTVSASERSFNNHYGVPLTILGTDSNASDLVLEMGANHPGEIAALGRIARPNIGVITNIGYAHIEHFGSLDRTAAAKSELVEAILPGGTLVLNGVDVRLARARQMGNAQGLSVLTAGMGPSNDVRAVDVQWDGQGARGQVAAMGQRVPFRLQLLGEHFLRAALLAVAVALRCGLTLEDAVAALGSFEVRSGRVRLSVLRDRTMVVDDTYNASPDAVLAALRAVTILGKPVRIAVLAEMRELGSFAEECHARVGEEVGKRFTHLVAIGTEGASIMARAAMASGMPKGRVAIVSEPLQALDSARSILSDAPEQTVVLVKGSRFAHTERVVLGLGGVDVRCPLATCTKYIPCSECPQLRGKLS